MWQALEAPALEYARITFAAGALAKAAGELVGMKNGRPFHASYHMAWAGENLVTVELASEHTTVLWVDAERRWHIHSAEQPGLAGCSALDVQETPFSNTWAFQVLGLSPGESRALDVVYAQLVEGTFTRERQVYTCLERDAQGSVYRFEHVSSGYTNTIRADTDGLVVEYPGLFARIFA
jgi:hypothetical protein